MKTLDLKGPERVHVCVEEGMCCTSEGKASTKDVRSEISSRGGGRE